MLCLNIVTWINYAARSFVFIDFLCTYLFITTYYCNTDDRRRMGGGLCAVVCDAAGLLCATINVVPDSSTVVHNTVACSMVFFVCRSVVPSPLHQQ